MDPARFRGTCYRAANWMLLGQTTGRGKESNSYVPNRSLKDVLGYPLASALPRVDERSEEAMTRRIDVNLEELDQVLDGARQAPLSDAGYDSSRALFTRWPQCGAAAEHREDQGRCFAAQRAEAGSAGNSGKRTPPGHGRNGADASKARGR